MFEVWLVVLVVVFGFGLIMGWMLAAGDVAGATVAPTSSLVTDESGSEVVFSIVLDAQPSALVTIGTSSSDTSEGTVSVTSVVFSSANWDTAQTVVVTGADDDLVDGAISYSVATSVASGDSNFNGVTVDDVATTNSDGLFCLCVMFHLQFSIYVFVCVFVCVCVCCLFLGVCLCVFVCVGICTRCCVFSCADVWGLLSLRVLHDRRRCRCDGN